MHQPRFRSLFFAAFCLPSLLACGNGEQSPPSDGAGGGPATERFSFFVTSLRAMQQLSGSPDGFGGDLRFGETGAGAGLRGADKLCTTIAEQSLPENAKTWRAFLSATAGEDGEQVDAIDRIGAGPWYDRVGRLLALNKADLGQVRPAGADEAIIDDLPNEDGVPNHAPDPMAGEVDNHDVLTGSNEQGALFSTDAGFTCNDWTSAVGNSGTPHCGHSWPRRGGPNGGPDEGPGMMLQGEGGAAPGGPMGTGGGMVFNGGGGPGAGPVVQGSGENWMSALDEAGCAPGAFIVEAGPPGANGTETVGDGGGYGAIYCFALSP